MPSDRGGTCACNETRDIRTPRHRARSIPPIYHTPEESCPAVGCNCIEQRQTQLQPRMVNVAGGLRPFQEQRFSIVYCWLSISQPSHSWNRSHMGRPFHSANETCRPFFISAWKSSSRRFATSASRTATFTSSLSTKDRESTFVDPTTAQSPSIKAT